MSEQKKNDGKMTVAQFAIYEAIPKGGLSDREREILLRFCSYNTLLLSIDTLDVQAIISIYDLCDRYGASYVRGVSMCWRAENDMTTGDGTIGSGQEPIW